MATRPEILLLDEVFGGLNQAEIEEAIALVKEIQVRYRVTIFIIEHVMKAIMRTCGRIMVIHQGVKIAEGPPGSARQPPGRRGLFGKCFGYLI